MEITKEEILETFEMLNREVLAVNPEWDDGQRINKPEVFKDLNYEDIFMAFIEILKRNPAMMDNSPEAHILNLSTGFMVGLIIGRKQAAKLS